MKIMNVIVVYDSARQKVLMCMRRKDPYKGKLNFVGGKAEPGETGMEAAYRELYEETAITKEDISLLHLMDMVYYPHQIQIEVYVGRLKREISVFGEENELLWLDASENFEDMRRFAGMGNIAHIMEIIRDDFDNIVAL